MFSVEQARELLGKAGLFFDADDGDDTEESRQKMAQTLNMNDVWGWACADGKYVPDDKLPELAALFYRYGWAGVLYWVSEQSGGMRSEFHDNNRFIDFVRHEERLRKEIPEDSQRAYKKIQYILGPNFIIDRSEEAQ